ncbi:MAG: O-antigen ligase family protein [Mariniphaga sp.]
MSDIRFKQFYFFIFFTALLPYFPYVIAFLPSTLLGFNWTGWAWIIMLVVTVNNLFKTENITFPIWDWLPWAIFLVVYLIVDFSFLGLQLTLQYLLPLFIGFIASGFTYSEVKLLWLFRNLMLLCVSIVLMFVYGYLFRNGYSPNGSSTPMLLSVAASILVGNYFMTKTKKSILYFALFFSVPFLDVTRMGIAVFLAIFIFHFANRKINMKILYGLIGLICVIIVFNSNSFQEKTFGENRGGLKDLSLNYYENSNIQNNGRNAWKMALEPGIIAKPMLGNGPRADNKELKAITGLATGEAHNDYMSIQFNYGYLGLALLLIGFGATFIRFLYMLKQINEPWLYLLCTSTMTLFISFLMFMYTDNILKYTIFFPDLFFALIGIVFSIYKNGWEKEEESGN